MTAEQNAKPCPRWCIVSDQGEFKCLEYGPFLNDEDAAIENLDNEEATK